MPCPSQPLAFSGLVVFALLERVEIHEFRQKIKGPFHPHGPFAQDDFIAALFFGSRTARLFPDLNTLGSD
jgi:hypothetical protein